MCIYINKYVHVCIYVYVYTYICIHVYIYTYICVCVCIPPSLVGSCMQDMPAKELYIPTQMCCSVLRHVAACCSMLQRVAVCCSMLEDMPAKELYVTQRSPTYLKKIPHFSHSLADSLVCVCVCVCERERERESRCVGLFCGYVGLFC